MSTTIGWIANAIGFAVLVKLCGRSIGKRDWEQSVFWFLLALGTIMYAVKSTPSF
jgi:predicted cobalt transporter CbtA